jgi:PAS domain S-box-containing protein
LINDLNLRVVVHALQRQLIDEPQFVSACAAWAGNGGGSIAELLVERGWLSDSERSELEALVERERVEALDGDLPTLTLATSGSLDGLIDLDELDLDLGDLPLTVRERITLRGLHSSGGIGEVWRAYDEVLDREVALKRLKQDQADYADNRARFLREARITGQLDHPGIVPVYDYNASEDGSRCYYTMRFLRGRTLAEVIADFHAEREPGDDMVSGTFLRLLGYFTSVCNTMAFAHSRGVVHRDLKGNNVIVGDFGEVIVLDWGLAKRIGVGHVSASEAGAGKGGPGDSLLGLSVMATMQGERLGTPAFMAPEQAQGDIAKIDPRTDVYGLAAILYEILTGHPPFSGEDVVVVMEEVIHREPTPPSELVPEIPPVLERICLRGLAKAREDRWQSVTELAVAVQGWLTALAERRRTEQERERFFDLSLDLLAIVDRQGRLTQSNAAWASLLGWSDEKRAGAELSTFVVPEHRELVAAKLTEIWAGAAQAELEVRARRADGSRCWINFRARSIPDEAGIYLVGRDVTERRQTEERFVGLVESAPDATCVIDEGGTIVIVNAALERMFGYPREELLGQPVEILVPESLREGHFAHVRRFVSQPKARPMGSGLKLSAQRRDGSVFRVEISLGPVQTETGMLVSCALRER